MLAPLALPNAPGLLHAKKKLGKRKETKRRKKEKKEEKKARKRKKERRKRERKREKRGGRTKRRSVVADHFCSVFEKKLKKNGFHLSLVFWFPYLPTPHMMCVHFETFVGFTVHHSSNVTFSPFTLAFFF